MQARIAGGPYLTGSGVLAAIRNVDCLPVRVIQFAQGCELRRQASGFIVGGDDQADPGSEGGRLGSAIARLMQVAQIAPYLDRSRRQP